MTSEFPSIKMVHYSDHEIKNMISSLVLKFKDENFNKIVAISRGGFVPAICVSEHCKIFEIHSIGITSYYSECFKNETIVYQRLSQTFSKEDKIIIVDDIADTGESLKIAIEEVKNNNGKYIKTFSVFCKEKSLVHPDYYCRMVENEDWIVFPWEKTKE